VTLVYCVQTRPNAWMDQDATWHGSRPRHRPNCVRWGASSPTERGTAAHFRNLWARSLPASVLSVTHVYCNQTAEWIKVPLTTEVGFGPGDIVLHGYPVPRRKGAPAQQRSPPLFGPCLLWRTGRPSQLLFSCCFSSFL